MKFFFFLSCSSSKLNLLLFFQKKKKASMLLHASLQRWSSPVDALSVVFWLVFNGTYVGTMAYGLEPRKRFWPGKDIIQKKKKKKKKKETNNLKI